MVKPNVVDVMFVTTAVIAVVAIAELPLLDSATLSSRSTSIPAAAPAVMPESTSAPTQITPVYDSIAAASATTAAVPPGAVEFTHLAMDSAPRGVKNKLDLEDKKKQVSKGAVNLSSEDTRVSTNSIIPKLPHRMTEVVVDNNPITVPSTGAVSEKHIDKDVKVQTESNKGDKHMVDRGKQPVKSSEGTYTGEFVPMHLPPCK